MGTGRKQEDPRGPTHTPGTRERREVCRYDVVQGEAMIGWWEGPAFRSTPAKIVDLSSHGAMLVIETFPPGDRTFWFRLPGVPAQDDWFEVKLISRKKKLFGPREFRINFLKVLPYEVFKAVVYGPDALRPYDPPAWLPEDAADRDWW